MTRRGHRLFPGSALTICFDEFTDYNQACETILARIHQYHMQLRRQETIEEPLPYLEADPDADPQKIRPLRQRLQQR